MTDKERVEAAFAGAFRILDELTISVLQLAQQAGAGDIALRHATEARMLVLRAAEVARESEGDR